MERQKALIDTSVIIEYFRKKKKHETFLFHLIQNNYDLKLTTIVYYELIFGAKDFQIPQIQSIISSYEVLPFDIESAELAIEVQKKLRIISQQIHIADLFIAATALANNLPVATLNKTHFERIEGLELINLS